MRAHQSVAEKDGLIFMKEYMGSIVLLQGQEDLVVLQWSISIKLERQENYKVDSSFDKCYKY